MIRRPPRSTPFPYPTPFRSEERERHHGLARAALHHHESGEGRQAGEEGEEDERVAEAVRLGLYEAEHYPAEPRSEEHTSELQSRQYLVCRLLLEKKKTTSLD